MQDTKTLRPLPRILFGSRWLQLPLYVGLIVAQCVYVVQFMRELWHLLMEVSKFNETSIMLTVLGLIDVVMISNLLIMVIIGGYETFVSRLNLDEKTMFWQVAIHVTFLVSALIIAAIDRIMLPYPLAHAERA
jgi:uncharacterized membrane protein YqhA